MDRKNWYFGQQVKESELDSAFDAVDAALKAFVGSFNYVGIGDGAEVTQNSPTNLTVVAAGPATIYDQEQRLIRWFPNQVVNCALDEDGAATTVPTLGYERWLSIFAEHQTVQSDPRVDEAGDTIYFSVTDSFRINVVQGAEASAGTAVRPPLRGDQILLADVKITQGQTAIVNANVSTTRTQVIYDLTGTPTAIRARSLGEVLQAMLDVLNTFGAGTISGAAISDSPLSLSSGSITAQLTQLLAHLNDSGALLARTSGNTFTTGPQKVDTNDATVALLSTTKRAEDHPSVGANPWKLLLDSPTGGAAGGIRTRVYVGNYNTLLGVFCITVNAAWSPSGNTWSADDTSVPAGRFYFDVARIGYQHKATTGSAWGDAAWSTNGTGGVGDLQITGELYTTGKLRTKRINMAKGVSTGEISGDGTSDWIYSAALRSWVSRVHNGIVTFPIDLPPGCTIKEIRALMSPADTTGLMSIKLYRSAGGTFTPAVAPTLTLIGSQDTDGSATLQICDLVSLTELITDSNEYQLTVHASSNGGTAGDIFHMLEVDYLDSGPRRN